MSGLIQTKIRTAKLVDRGKVVEPGFHVSFEDPADFLEPCK
jgi:hypothetical protein